VTDAQTAHPRAVAPMSIRVWQQDLRHRRGQAPLGERERQQLMQLGADLELAWSHPAVIAATRRWILRTALGGHSRQFAPQQIAPLLDDFVGGRTALEHGARPRNWGLSG
jgi:hypothetical protein